MTRRALAMLLAAALWAAPLAHAADRGTDLYQRSQAALWAVDDGGTQALMTAFYQALQREGTTKAEALRQAQLALLAAPGGDAGESPRGVPGAGVRRAGAGLQGARGSTDPGSRRA